MAADQAEGTAGSGAAQANQSDAMIDTSVVSRSAQKVELDLDDAPFLEEEEDVQPELPKPAESISVEAPKETKPSFFAGRKKLIIIAAAALVVLVAAAITVKIMFFKGAAAPAPAPVEKAAPKEPVQENATAAAPELPDIQIKMEPFWVEQKGEGDEVRFLIVRMLLITKDQLVVKEMETKLLAMRNAIFYYLKNKDVQFLTDEHNAEKLKAELLLVVNQYLAGGKFDTVMFEEYVVK